MTPANETINGLPGGSAATPSGLWAAICVYWLHEMAAVPLGQLVPLGIVTTLVVLL